MTSKARFNKGTGGGSTTGVNKRGKMTTGMGSGFAPASSKPPSTVQIIYNGKIVTPVSLLSRPKVSVDSRKTSKGDSEVKETQAANNIVDGQNSQEEDKNKPIAKKDSMANNRSR